MSWSCKSLAIAASWSGEHGAGAPGLALISSPSAPRRREHGHEKVRPESLRSSSTALEPAPPPSPGWERGREAVRRVLAATATRRHEESEEAMFGGSTWACGAEEEGGVGVEIDGSGDGGGAVDDGVLACEDDLAGRAGAHFHRSPMLRRTGDWIHGTK
jgi:hypothetical protein|uniref:Uncharacterized protein n=1 Tax=Zea mays TaxID=4577 RepID=A0A804P5E5_MAIZE